MRSLTKTLSDSLSGLHHKYFLSGLIRSYTMKIHFCQILHDNNSADKKVYRVRS